MATHVAGDSQLLREAVEIGGHKTRHATLNEALEEYVRRRRQQEILDLFGRIEWDPNYVYKAQRCEP